ncbi:MAG: NAD-dependent epimerase/dehydratase family protein [Bacteroidota bacterium]
MNNIIAEDLTKIISTKLPWKDISGKTVLITGASGLLASYIVETLLELKLNINVIALVRNKKNALIRFIDYKDDKNLDIIDNNINLPLSIEKNIHFIIHAAGQASPKYFGTDPVGTMLPNVIGTYNLLELARKKNVEKFLYFSSCEVYGNAGEVYDEISETNFGVIDPINLRSSYSESKRAGETLCISYNSQFKVPTLIVRPFHTYGPKLAIGDGRVFADFVYNIVNNQDISIYGDGLAERSFCYISDATVGFFTILLNGKIGEAYNLANPKCEISIENLAKVLVNIFPEKKLEIKKYQNTKENYIPSKINKFRPNILKIMELGWIPTVSIYEGFKRTILSFE